MNGDKNFLYKEMISRYIDKEVTSQEKETIERLLKEDKALYAYYEQMKQLDKVLNDHSVEETSSDWERKVRASFDVTSIKEEQPMRTNYLSKVSIGAGVLATLFVCFLMLQTYSQRTLQGRLRSAADDIGDQYSPGNTNVYRSTVTSSQTDASKYLVSGTSQLASTTQYEPYYLQSN